MESLKLYLFLRDEVGKNNGNVSNSELTRNVAEVVKNYWAMAGFPTKNRIDREVGNLAEQYSALLKSKSRTSDKVMEQRKDFENEMSKLFDIADPFIEEKLACDRIRGHLNIKSEDLDFLEDQRGPRVGWMNKADEEYSARVKKSLKRSSPPHHLHLPCQ